jgi:hypothetical protein
LSAVTIAARATGTSTDALTVSGVSLSAGEIARRLLDRLDRPDDGTAAHWANYREIDLG